MCQCPHVTLHKSYRGDTNVIHVAQGTERSLHLLAGALGTESCRIQGEAQISVVSLPWVSAGDMVTPGAHVILRHEMLLVQELSRGLGTRGHHGLAQGTLSLSLRRGQNPGHPILPLSAPGTVEIHRKSGDKTGAMAEPSCHILPSIRNTGDREHLESSLPPRSALGFSTLQQNHIPAAEQTASVNQTPQSPGVLVPSTGHSWGVVVTGSGVTITSSGGSGGAQPSSSSAL